MMFDEARYIFDISEPFIIEGIDGDDNAVIAKTETLIIQHSSSNQGASTCEIRYRILDNNPSAEKLFKYRLLGKTLDERLA